MLDRITSMEVLARVAALGSLSAAARALSMSPTMATKHVGALEARLGVKLIHRTTRKISLTEAGRLYLERVEPALEAVADAEGAASRAAQEVSGTLRLSAPVSFGIREIASLLPALAAEHPKLVVDLGLNDRVVDLLEEGWDLSIRIGDLASSTMVARRLAPCRLAVCASPAYLARCGTPRTVAELTGHACLGYTLSRATGADRWTFGGGQSVAVSGPLRANNGDVLVAAAVAGEGIVYQPTFLVRQELAAGALVALTLDVPAAELAGVYAVYPADRRPPAKVRAAIDFFADKFGAGAPWDAA